jgi:Mg/Co/Ni transporter MgtE
MFLRSAVEKWFMLSLEVVLAQSQAYAAGSTAGLIVRTVVLGLITAALIRRIARNEFGTGIRNSAAGTVVSVLVAGGLFLYSVGQILNGGPSDRA